MKERPIIFSGPMVRAILDGRKTQTRRVVKPQPLYVSHDGVPFRRTIDDPNADALEVSENYPTSALIDVPIRCPYGVPGDRLWVREGLQKFIREPATAQYASTFEPVMGGPRCDVVGRALWRSFRSKIPSIHMPRWASRLTLEVVATRVERLSAITDEDAVAEGARELPLQKGAPGAWWTLDGKRHVRTPRAAYLDGFRAMNKLAADADPWVWVVEFRRLP